MKSAGIGFSSGHNARYGMREWPAVLAGTCSRFLTSESAARNLGSTRDMPTEKWLCNMMDTINRDGAEAVCGTMAGRTARPAKRRGMGRTGSAPAAADRHLIGRFDRGGMGHPAYSARKNGSNRSGAYATVQVVAEPVNAEPGCARIARGSSDVDFVRKFVQTLRDYKICARLVLLDREFDSIDVMNAPPASGNRYLVPAVKNAGIKRAMMEHT